MAGDIPLADILQRLRDPGVGALVVDKRGTPYIKFAGAKGDKYYAAFSVSEEKPEGPHYEVTSGGRTFYVAPQGEHVVPEGNVREVVKVWAVIKHEDVVKRYKPKIYGYVAGGHGEYQLIPGHPGPNALVVLGWF